MYLLVRANYLEMLSTRKNDAYELDETVLQGKTRQTRLQQNANVTRDVSRRVMHPNQVCSCQCRGRCGATI